ncbi:MAG TPA: phosphate acyltransferase PlsX [Fimbriimonadaceae bacterium]|nr:phosphate acyltransferase PlsX [Fimbriimonadaceae bacterium]
MRIAVDAMGGDDAPKAVVHGAVQAATHLDGGIVLVGDPEAIKRCVNGPLPSNVDIHMATEVIGMDEKPMEAIRKKKDSSLAVGVQLVKEGHAQAFLSAGNTGAVTAASLLSWRQIEGVHRPAIASPFPNHRGQFLLLDAGASPDVDPIHLLEFAVMGRAYAESVMGRRDPKVHLLNIGEEPGKGNAFAKQAYELLSGHEWFAGNIEGKDMFSQDCDVVVCDAFVGNIVLKTAEGVGEFIMDEIKASVPKGIGRLAFLPLKKALAPLRKKVDYAEYGGSPLLGLNGLCIICHGRSNAKAIRNAIMIAATALKNELVPSICKAISQEKKLD